jgi:hypothetical protein
MRNPVRRQVRVLAPLLAALLGGCSLTQYLPDRSAGEAANPEPQYRYIVANQLDQVLSHRNRIDRMRISAPRFVDSLIGAAWLVCLEVESYPAAPRHHAVFIQRERIVEARLSVMIDRCEEQSYAPFDWVAEANIPPMQ